jgi:hypothetical protein
MNRYQLENRLLAGIFFGCLAGLALCWWLG